MASPRPARRSRGPSAPAPPDLARRLRRAATDELRRLVADEADRLGVVEVRQALLNPFATAEVIEELAAIRRLHPSVEVRAAIARHPRTPDHVALRFVPGLFWRDLLAVAAEVRIVARVRRVAERYLLKRLPSLAVGERIAIARRATREVVAVLRRDREPRVVAALLDNPGLVEEDLVPLAADVDAPPRVLDVLARNPRWGARYTLRAALATNPRSPLRAVFAILPTLKRPELEAVLGVGELPSIVGHRARALLAERGVVV